MEEEHQDRDYDVEQEAKVQKGRKRQTPEGKVEQNKNEKSRVAERKARLMSWCFGLQGFIWLELGTRLRLSKLE